MHRSRNGLVARFARAGTALAGALAVLVLAGTGPASAQDGKPVRLVSHRYPALEFYADKMKSALPGVTVTTDLMPNAQAAELQTITLSSGSDSIDILWGNDLTITNFAANGWLEPLDEFFEKYKDEFNLDDIAPAALNAVSYNGKKYALPILTNTMLFAYREDVLKDKGLAPPASFEDYEKAAKALHSPAMAGTVMTLKGEGTMNEAHWYLTAIGDGWFDKDGKPVFNSPNGVKAIETMKRMAQYAPRGYTANGNDESTILFQQGAAAMGLQWLTRTAAMENPQQSRVVGKMNWVAPPGGKQIVVADSYAISKFSSKDKDTLFRLLATTLSAANQREGADRAVPTRISVLQDPELQQRFRYYKVLVPALQDGTSFPKFPEFKEVSELVSRRIVQAVTGEMPVQEALDTGAKEAEEFLTRRGFYKK